MTASHPHYEHSPVDPTACHAIFSETGASPGDQVETRGVFDKFKLVAQAMSPGNIKRGIELSKQSMANGGQLTEEQMAGWTPEQREQYQAAMQKARQNMAANADQVIEAEQARRVLLGPAGDYLYGPLPDRERMTDLSFQGQWAASKADFMDTLRNPFGKKAPPPPPPTPPVSVDRDQQYAHERAQREEARTPYLAPGRPPVVMTRLALDRKTNVQDLATWLGTAGLAARPDLVYGIYRVPDHIVGSWGIRHQSGRGGRVGGRARGDAGDAGRTAGIRRGLPRPRAVGRATPGRAVDPRRGPRAGLPPRRRSRARAVPRCRAHPGGRGGDPARPRAAGRRTSSSA